ncbi:hypothetical protein LCGC14_0453800 [marine sediment metagenome]|uniref:Uncharacterized protein n=1 Tax=marine sediment metagenome TaxID=412755 RepID=A0A0F9SGX0_9ZZZZ
MVLKLHIFELRNIESSGSCREDEEGHIVVKTKVSNEDLEKIEQYVEKKHYRTDEEINDNYDEYFLNDIEKYIKSLGYELFDRFGVYHISELMIHKH